MTAPTYRSVVRLPENRHLAEGEPIQTMSPPRKVIIPLQQHAGAPCPSAVDEGQTITGEAPPGDMAAFLRDRGAPSFEEACNFIEGGEQ